MPEGLKKKKKIVVELRAFSFFPPTERGVKREKEEKKPKVSSFIFPSAEVEKSRRKKETPAFARSRR